MIREAHAKVNLTLSVLGVRSDGYHDLSSAVAPIPLCDTLAFDAPPASQAGRIRVLGCDGIPEGKNLAYRAAVRLATHAGVSRGAVITIAKRIPSGAGLGGGSADAACVLRALNDFWQLNLPRETLCRLGAEIGSDVPALVWNEPVLMEGRGERVRPLPSAPSAAYGLPEGVTPQNLTGLVLETPPVFSSTPAVYAAFRESDRGLGLNDLEPAATRLYPEIRAALDRLRARGLSHVRLTGSGSSVFGFASEN